MQIVSLYGKSFLFGPEWHDISYAVDLTLCKVSPPAKLCA